MAEENVFVPLHNSLFIYDEIKRGQQHSVPALSVIEKPSKNSQVVTRNPKEILKKDEQGNRKGLPYTLAHAKM